MAGGESDEQTERERNRRRGVGRQAKEQRENEDNLLDDVSA